MWSYLVLLICFCSLFESKTLESGKNTDNDASLHGNEMMKGNATNSGRNSTNSGKPEIGDVHIQIKSEVRIIAYWSMVMIIMAHWNSYVGLDYFFALVTINI